MREGDIRRRESERERERGRRERGTEVRERSEGEKKEREERERERDREREREGERNTSWRSESAKAKSSSSSIRLSTNISRYCPRPCAFSHATTRLERVSEFAHTSYAGTTMPCHIIILVQLREYMRSRIHRTLVQLSN